MEYIKKIIKYWLIFSISFSVAILLKKNIQTILQLLFEYKELFIFLITSASTIITVILNYIINRSYKTSNIKNNTDDNPEIKKIFN